MAEATRYLDLHPSLPADTPKEITDGFQAIRIPVLLNTALTALKVNPPAPQVGIDAASRVLKYEGITTAEKSKALYRQGLAYVMTKQDEEAEGAFTEADTLLEGKDAAIKAELEKVKARKKAKRDKERKAFASMFSSN